MTMGSAAEWTPENTIWMLRVMAMIAKPTVVFCLNPDCGQPLHPGYFNQTFLCHNCQYPWETGDLKLLVNESQIIGYPVDDFEEEFPTLRILVAIRGDELVSIPS